MSIFTFSDGISVSHSMFNNPLTVNPYYARLVAYNTETNNFIFDFKTPIIMKGGKLFLGKLEIDFKINALDFLLNGRYKNLLDILIIIKSAGAISKIYNIPTDIYNELYDEGNAHVSKTIDDFISILKQIDSGKYNVETELIQDEDYDDSEDGNSMLNLNGQYYIKDEENTLSSIASHLLISRNGQPNWFNIKTLKNEGFNVLCTEEDSYGWLGAAVRTKKGLIFFD